MFKSDSAAIGGGIGCVLLTLILNCTIGWWSVTYLVETLLHKNIAWGWALLIGLIGGELTVPAAIIVWLLKVAGIL